MLTVVLLCVLVLSMIVTILKVTVPKTGNNDIKLVFFSSNKLECFAALMFFNPVFYIVRQGVSLHLEYDIKSRKS